MGIHPTLLPVSPTAPVRPAFFQSHLHPLPVFLVYPFLSPLLFLSFPLPNCLSRFQLIFLFLCPWSQPSKLLMSLPYNFPQEFPTVPVLSSCYCVPHISHSLLCCVLSLCLSGSSPLLDSPCSFYPSIYTYISILSFFHLFVHPSIHTHASICPSIIHSLTFIIYLSFHHLSMHSLSIYPHIFIHPSTHPFIIYSSIHHVSIQLTSTLQILVYTSSLSLSIFILISPSLALFCVSLSV